MIKQFVLKNCGLLFLLFFVLPVFSSYAAGPETPEKKRAPSIITETQPTPHAPAAPTAAPAAAAAASEDAHNHVVWRITAAIVFIILIFGGFLGYMIYLQRKFFEGCREDKQMATFFNSPAGLPVGTVRAVIALIIITVSLSLIVLNVFQVGIGSVPDMIVGILGTVLGFYFGSRSSGGGDEGAREQINSLTTQRDEAVAQQDATQAGSIVGKIKNGLSMSKMAIEFLPEEQKKKYGDFIAKMETGVNMAETLTGAGNLKEAAVKANEVYDLFKSGNPAQDTFTKAVQSFGQVLGTAVPAAAIAGTVAVLCTKLAGAVYQKWKARVLHAPFSPAIMQLKVVDANTGFTLMLNSPIFKKAFARELEANDRPFMESAVAILGQTDVEEFWTKYRERFENREQFETGLEEFRRAAADLELLSDISPELLGEAGGYKTFMDSIDKINSNPEAKADLDKLVIVNESLHKNGAPVLSILDKVKCGVPS